MAREQQQQQANLIAFTKMVWLSRPVEGLRVCVRERAVAQALLCHAPAAAQLPFVLSWYNIASLSRWVGGGWGAGGSTPWRGVLVVQQSCCTLMCRAC
jgi:hypothetical protein